MRQSFEAGIEIERVAAQKKKDEPLQGGEYRGENGRAGRRDKSRRWRFDSVAVKELRSAKWNKAMNDASKKGLVEIDGLKSGFCKKIWTDWRQMRKEDE